MAGMRGFAIFSNTEPPPLAWSSNIEQWTSDVEFPPVSIPQPISWISGVKGRSVLYVYVGGDA